MEFAKNDWHVNARRKLPAFQRVGVDVVAYDVAVLRADFDNACRSTGEAAAEVEQLRVEGLERLARLAEVFPDYDPGEFA